MAAEKVVGSARSRSRKKVRPAFSICTGHEYAVQEYLPGKYEIELMGDISKRQYAVQLVGSDQLILNRHKDVTPPGAFQILCRVEAVGLCFSDLKLLKQFSGHVRKGDIVCGIEPEILEEIPSYVPGDLATVPGHETVVRIAAVGENVEDFKPGERYLVQTDYRWLRTAGSNGAFGYNFEGALQEYVLMDERVITSPQGQSFLIPVGEDLSASAIALAEPWACVEHAYASSERRCIKGCGRLLVYAEAEIGPDVLRSFLGRGARPGDMTWVSKSPAPDCIDVELRTVAGLSEIADGSFDDVVYFGSDAKVIEELFCRVGTCGLFNIVLCGGKLGREVVTPVGRIHYGGIRIVGTPGWDAGKSLEHIPETGEIRPGDKIHMIGAGGPMGMMHTIRSLCLGVEGVSVFANDVDPSRMANLTRIASPLARQNNVPYRASEASRERVADGFDYAVLMAPLPELVAGAVRDGSRAGIINIFAGIPAAVTAEIDLDAYIEKQLYFIGTSGSELEDMKRMLSKVESCVLDTNVCVGAVSGLAGAAEGIRAVENRSIAGKIIVYPGCRELGLVELKDMPEQMPHVAECLSDGLWNKRAEDRLLATYRDSQSH
ncbi:MAG: alcohol dehydrogenase catalytic domain-containing protein [Planctomycetota bacterium]